jgi:serine/threonine protein kinase
MADQIDPEEAIFQAVIQLEDPTARMEYLGRACGSDRALRAQIISLLKAHDCAGDFLEPPLTGFRIAAAAAGVETRRLPAPPARPVTEKAGDHIGRYKLLQKIGEGGCGIVYLAEQEEPVRRRVALKIIKVGMDTKQVIARFEAERQALAMMDHPNIARVLDAGATDTGRPYFVMDLVRGIRITEHCDQGSLFTAARLDLFAQVCHAIQHAHQKGIIHRDIKPSNILVTLHDGVPLPVIIDFGIAKATEQRLTNKTLFTAFEQFVGTPAYMSPEQAEMSHLDIDTRSDIYSLGVLLYELLTGKTPFDPKTLVEAGIDAMRRTIREKEPPRPSTCLSTMLEADLTTVAKHRHAEPLRLIHQLRGDLDWIVMKCLEKDRTRRYETANALALDIQRYLHSEPVLARPPSNLYRLQKTMRRDKAAFLAAGAVALALLAGFTISTYLYFLQREAYRRAVLAERNQNRLRRDAEAARASEAAERRGSEENARFFRLNSYAADVSGAFLALQSANLGRAVDLLERQVPKPGEQDLRGFEWRYLWQRAQGDELVSLAQDGLVSCALFAPDGQHVATASYDGNVRIWNLASKQVVQTLDGFEREFGWRYLAYSADGKWFAGVRQGSLNVWDCSSNSYALRFEKKIPARVIAFTPDSKRLVGWDDHRLSIVDLATWETDSVITQLSPGSYPSLAINRALDQTSQLIALAHEGSWAIEVWELDSRAPKAWFTFPGHSGAAFVSLAWAPDGLLAATTWSGRLMLLDSRTGEELASTQAHAGSIFGPGLPGRENGRHGGPRSTDSFLERAQAGKAGHLAWPPGRDLGVGVLGGQPAVCYCRQGWDSQDLEPRRQAGAALHYQLVCRRVQRRRSFLRDLVRSEHRRFLGPVGGGESCGAHDAHLVGNRSE